MAQHFTIPQQIVANGIATAAGSCEPFVTYELVAACPNGSCRKRNWVRGKRWDCLNCGLNSQVW